MILFYSAVFSLLIYSFALIDLNLTLFNNRLWELFRSKIIYLGYFRRDLSWQVFLIIMIALFIANYQMTINAKRYNPVKIAFFTSLILLFSYSFLSHDFIKYLFDAKILTFYHQNPYIIPPMNFYQDNWLRFTQWVHQPYRYGPLYLLISAIPSFLSFNKFILSFVFLKAVHSAFFIASVFFVNKINRRAAVFYATSPLVLVEGLVNGHNDIVGVAIVIIASYLLIRKKPVYSRLLMIASAGIKYITFPFIILVNNKKSLINKSLFVLMLILPFLFLLPVFTFIFRVELQEWYFLTLFGFILIYDDWLIKLTPFFFGLMISYYPYIRLGGWDTADKVILKQEIIVASFILNMIYLLGLNLLGKKKTG